MFEPTTPAKPVANTVGIPVMRYRVADQAGIKGVAIDWENTTSLERRCLYRAVLALKKRRGMNWQDVFTYALHEAVGARYEDNFRKGEISPAKAFKLFNWLLKNDAALAETAENDILILRAAQQPAFSPNWEALVAAGRFEQVRVIKVIDDLGIVSFARGDPVDSTDLKLRDQSYFEIDVPFGGQLIAFQAYRGEWFLLPLSETSAVIEMKQGICPVPIDDNREAFPLTEETTPGRYGFLFVLLSEDHGIGEGLAGYPSQPLQLPVRDDIAKAVFRVPERHRAVFRTNLLFTRG